MRTDTPVRIILHFRRTMVLPQRDAQFQTNVAIKSIKLTRVNQSHVIATSTKVDDISGVNVDGKYFEKQVEKKKKEGEFFQAEKENVLPGVKKEDQKSVDASLIKSIESAQDLKGAEFSLKAGMKTQEFVF